MSTKAPRFLIQGKKHIEKRLDVFVDLQFKKIQKRWPFFYPLLPPLKKYLKRQGKRLRPTLTILSYYGFSAKKDQKIYLPALATEMLHTSFLIYDDIYDAMPKFKQTRGGEKVLTDIYCQKFAKLNPQDSNWQPLLFSQHSAQVAVHLFLSLGANALLESDFSPRLKNKAMAIYWNTIQEGFAGQGIDILSKSKPVELVSENEIKALELSRSAAYTIKFPLILGAALAQASPKNIKILSSYALKVGLAYQICDDILGIFAQPSDTGKLQNELAEGKRTLLIQKTLELGSKRQAEMLLTLLKNPSASRKNLKLAQSLIKDSKALDKVHSLQKQLVSSAKNQIDLLSADSRFKKNLSQLADFVIHRER